jgi:hypothetical protein
MQAVHESLDDELCPQVKPFDRPDYLRFEVAFDSHAASL